MHAELELCTHARSIHQMQVSLVGNTILQELPASMHEQQGLHGLFDQVELVTGQQEHDQKCHP